MQLTSFLKINPETAGTGDAVNLEWQNEIRYEWPAHCRVGGGAAICVFVEREQDGASMVIQFTREEAVALRDGLTKQIRWHKKQDYPPCKSRHPALDFAKEVQVGDRVTVWNLMENETQDPWEDLKGEVIEIVDCLEQDFNTGDNFFVVQLDTGAKIISRYVKRLTP